MPYVLSWTIESASLQLCHGPSVGVGIDSGSLLRIRQQSCILVVCGNLWPKLLFSSPFVTHEDRGLGMRAQPHRCVWQWL